MKKSLYILFIIINTINYSCFAQNFLEKLSLQKTQEDSLILIYDYLKFIKSTSQNEEVIDVLQKIDFSLIGVENDSVKAYLYEVKGGVCQKQGGTKLAESNFDEAIIYYEKAKDKKSLGRINLMKSKIYISNFDFEESLKYSLKSLKICNEIGDMEGQAKAYNQIGIIHDYQEQYDDALVYYKKSLNLYKKLDLKKGISNEYNNIGVLFDLKEEVDSALYYYKLSLKIDSDLNDVLGIAGSKINIGLIYQYREDFEKTEKLFLEALDLYQIKSNDFGLGISYINLANLYRTTEEYQNAINNVNKSIELSTKINDMRQLTESYKMLILIYKDNDKFELAFNAQNDLMNLKDSLYSTFKKTDLNSLKEKISVLEKENSVISLGRNKVLIDLKESEKVNKELIIASFLGLLIIVGLFYFYVQFKNDKKQKMVI